jgi:hypothetical protein
MDDVYLNPLLGQPPCEPEPIAPGLKGNGDARDGATFADCLIAPAVQEAQERGFVQHDLLQGLSFDTWHGSGDQPARLAQLDDRDQGAILIKRDKAPAEIVGLGHSTLHCSCHCDDGVISSPPAP